MTTPTVAAALAAHLAALLPADAAAAAASLPQPALAAASLSRRPFPSTNGAIPPLAEIIAAGSGDAPDDAPGDILAESLIPADAPVAVAAILVARLTALPPASQAVARSLVLARSFALTANLAALAAAPALLPTLAALIDKWAMTSAAAAPPAIAPSFSAAAAAILVPLCVRLNAMSSDPPQIHLSPIHPLALKHCIIAKNYRAALPIVNVPITDIASPSTGLASTLDILLFHYYGGIVLIGLRRFTEAIRFFDTCLHIPTITASLVQIEAYRRLVLLSLLVRGELLPSSKAIPLPVTRACRIHSQAYLDLANNYASPHAIRSVNNIPALLDRFAADRNLGLTRQCIDNLARRRILQLTKTYMSLSLTDIVLTLNALGSFDHSGSAVSFAPHATTTPTDPHAAGAAVSRPRTTSQAVHSAQIADIERQVIRMIDADQVLATISHADGGMVFFHDSSENNDTLATTEFLEREIRAAFDIDADASRLAKRIGISRDYLARAMTVRRDE